MIIDLRRINDFQVFFHWIYTFMFVSTPPLKYINFVFIIASKSKAIGFDPSNDIGVNIENCFQCFAAAHLRLFVADLAVNCNALYPVTTHPICCCWLLGVLAVGTCPGPWLCGCMLMTGLQPWTDGPHFLWACLWLFLQAFLPLCDNMIPK